MAPVIGSSPAPINFRQHKPIGAFKGRQKFVEEIARTGIAVRLEDHRQRPLPTVANGADGGANLRRMMAIIVDHHNAVGLAFDFKAAMNTAEGFEGLGDMGERNFQFMGHRNRGQRIGRAMFSRRAQAQFAQ